MTKTQNLGLIFMIAVLFVAIAFGVGLFTYNVQGSAPSGLPSTVATSSKVAVATGETVELFASSSRCTSRVISTTGSGIVLSFGEVAPYGVASSTLAVGSNAETVGHLQLASTTVAYDGGIYGCGEWHVRGVDATANISIVEFE